MVSLTPKAQVTACHIQVLQVTLASQLLLLPAWLITVQQKPTVHTTVLA